MNECMNEVETTQHYIGSTKKYTIAYRNIKSRRILYLVLCERRGLPACHSCTGMAYMAKLATTARECTKFRKVTRSTIITTRQ